jgi:hypothetical protein
MKKNRKELKRTKRNLRNKRKKKNGRVKILNQNIVNNEKDLIYYPWESEGRERRPPTKEGMESFFLEIGDKNPLDYSQEENHELERQKRTNSYLWNTWFDILGFRWNFEDKRFDLLTEEGLGWFVELEKLITNNNMFWCLVNRVWITKSEVLTQYPEMFERYGRNNVPLEIKLSCLEHLRIVSGKYLGTKICTTKESWIHWFENTDDEITLYRSFKVEKGKSVRKGGYKIGNDNSHIQESGRGWSYSTNKTNSIFINGLLSTYFYKKYLNLDDSESKIKLKENRKLPDWRMKDTTMFGDYYNCLGEYRVNKKDILFMTDEMGESEVVVDPKKVDFIDYRFLNIIDSMTQSSVLNIICGENCGGRNSVMNIDSFYSFIRNVVKKMVRKYPHTIQTYLNSSYLNRNNRSWSDELIEMIPYESLEIVTIPLENGNNKKFLSGQKKDGSRLFFKESSPNLFVGNYLNGDGTELNPT